MASVPHSLLSSSVTSASDPLRSSSNGLNGIPLRLIGRARLGVFFKEFTVTAKIKKGKKHDYPWPNNPDPNVKGGVLSHLSYFKPLQQKQNPVTLDFEKPLVNLEKKIEDVRKLAQETGLDFKDQIVSLENKHQQALKDLYKHLTPIQRVYIARHPNRPTFLDHILNITDKWVELHGDRAGYDDPAIVTGIGSIDGRPYMFIGQQKGRNTRENIHRNFGMPTPHGYRKALRMMYYADHHGFPIVTFIDTPGAFADLKSEELGQGESIAQNLRTMFGLKVPIVSIVIGEGGSGGALAIGCANKLLMLENAVFYVASPEACAAILWKSAKAAPKAAEQLKITAPELVKLKVADGIIPEPVGGAHSDPSWTSQQIKAAIAEAMDELLKMDIPELLSHRMLKFRHIGGFLEGIPVDPEKKLNMKKKDEPISQKVKLGRTPDIELENEVGKLKQVLKFRVSSFKPTELELNEMIEKLRREVNQEFSVAVNAMDLGDRLEMLREEFAKARNSPDQLINQGLKDKIEKLKQEFNQGLSEAPNYDSLNYKLDMLKEICKAKKLSEQNGKTATLKQEINKRFKEVMDRPDIKEKLEALKADVANAGVSTERDLDSGLKAKILKVKKEIELELTDVLKSLNLDVEAIKSKFISDQTSLLDFKVKIEELNDEIGSKIEAAASSSDIKSRIELLKLEIAMAGRDPGPDTKTRINSLIQQIKQSLAEAVSSSELIEKHEKLKEEMTKTMESSGGSNGSMNLEDLKGGSLEDASRLKNND
uniref:acetyl-CoA carboxytransferase n=1 Tax=Nelumbo nucifera TaxID=4432 RepID=A0A822Y5U6_NELNU|nr:TPA_asm: hypothetical protein HUJ06_030822 [Nelumbo nucifera]